MTSPMNPRIAELRREIRRLDVLAGALGHPLVGVVVKALMEGRFYYDEDRAVEAAVAVLWALERAGLVEASALCSEPDPGACDLCVYMAEFDIEGAK